MISPLTELRVGSAEFDQPPCPVKTKLIICSTPRSGSYLLCRAMIHNGIGIPHEYFNGINAGILSSRYGLGTIDSRHLEAGDAARRAYVAALLERRTINGIFAAKIQRGQFRQYFKSTESLELFQDAQVIYLYREDLLAQAISLHLSLLTGRWGVDDTVTTRPVADPQFFDNDLIAKQLEELATQDKEWRLFFANNAIRPLFLSYEGIKNDLAGALRKIVTSFGLHLPSQDFNYVERPPIDIRGPSEPSKSEIKDRFLQAVREK